MKPTLKIIALTVAATLFYTYVGHMVPQKETYPPRSLEIRLDMTTAEMVKIGEEIVGGKGTCLSCHTIGSKAPGRFPDLGGIGARANARKEGMSGVDYLAESLYDPNAYVVEGFNPGMIAANRPPISLTDTEILTVIAYLQSMGSTPTVTMQTEIAFAKASSASTTGGSSSSGMMAVQAGSDPAGGGELLIRYMCTTCHSLDAPTPLVGPSLYDVGSRLTIAALYESILEPDVTISEGFTEGVMPVTLGATGFYETVSTSELRTMVAYLASLRGNE